MAAADSSSNGARGIDWIDRANEWVGRTVAWLTLAMVVVTFAVVVLRYVFSVGWIWIQESVTWMHAAVFMLGAAWALRTGDHVRVDIFYRRCSSRAQAAIDLVGSLLLLLPFCGYIAYEAAPYVAQSFAVRESSREASGLAAVWLLKGVILLAALQLALQGLSEAVRAARRWSGG
jgi:TRAP-type mannitol/chloroaromatic compound transport system permease small subunit